MNAPRALIAALTCLAVLPASAAQTVTLKDGSTLEVFATEPPAPYPYGDIAVVFGVERRLAQGPLPRPLTSLVAVKFGDWEAAGSRPEGIDLAWGDSGFARIPIWGEEDEYRANAIDGQGRILVLGRAPDPAQVAGDAGNLEANNSAYNRLNRKYYLSLARLLPDGRPDRTFNGTGRTVFHLAPIEDPSDEKLLHDADGLVFLDGGIVSVRRGSVQVAKVADDGTVDIRSYDDRSAPGVRAGPIAFAPAIEFVNDSDQYFLTASPEEASFLDRGGAGRWHRTGRAIRTFLAGTPGQASLPSCRFYGDPARGLGNHFYTVDAAECALLADDPSLGWKLESRDTFRLEKPDAAGACGAGRDAVFRLLALRGDSAHRYTTDWNLARAAVESGRWIKEGFGPDAIAMCAPAVAPF